MLKSTEYKKQNLTEAVTQSCSVKKVSLEISQNSQKSTCTRVSLLIKLQAETRVYFLIKLQAQACNFIKKEALSRVFSYEFCEISKKTCFIEPLWLLQKCWRLSFSIISNFRRIFEKFLGSGIPELKNRVTNYDVIKPS